jgi:hypothetical protein
VRNNILYVVADGDRLAMLDRDGVLDLSHNWLKPGYEGSHGTLSGTIADDGTSVLGEAPGFEDEAQQGYRLDEDSDCLDAGGSLHPDASVQHAAARQYFEHLAGEQRPDDGFPDLGAFERCPTAGCALFSDGFESGDGSAWSTIDPLR